MAVRGTMTQAARNTVIVLDDASTEVPAKWALHYILMAAYLARHDGDCAHVGTLDSRAISDPGTN